MNGIKEEVLKLLEEYMKNDEISDMFNMFQIVFNILQDTDLLEDFLARLSEAQRDALYSHPFVQENDLLP